MCVWGGGGGGEGGDKSPPEAETVLCMITEF